MERNLSVPLSKLREIVRHCFCRLGVDEYVETDGLRVVCIECESCGKVLLRLEVKK